MAINDDPQRCVYIAPYENLPEVARNVYLESDPTDSLSVLWEEGTNFGLSYDFLKIKDSLRGEYSTIDRSQGQLTEADAKTKKVSPGSALFTLTRATTASSALSALQDTFDLVSWQHIMMSTEGTSTGDSQVPGDAAVPVGYESNLCCGATEVFDAQLDKTSDAAALPRPFCQGLTSVRIIPFATYTE